MQHNLFAATYACLMESGLENKLARAGQLFADWQAGLLVRDDPLACPVLPVPVPGRPAQPELVHPRDVPQRKLSSLEGRCALLHAVAHIEFNAINLALDAVYRFRDMPDGYYRDWLQVAAEEAYHFTLLRERMTVLGVTYGDLPAHNGLWEQACKTDYDVMVRMALVPRVLEARGLDVTPGMMERLREVGDSETVAVLEIILRDEIGHVRIGSQWFHYCCQQRQVEPDGTFRQLICDVMQAPLRGPFFTEARLQAGFTEAELERLLVMEKDCSGH